MIDTIRLILFTECNMSCSYCCNEQEQFNKQFVKKKFEEIDFSLYTNICITGGEPFLRKSFSYEILHSLPRHKKIYIYTNGMLIDQKDVFLLEHIAGLKCINIGLHTINQLSKIILVEEYLPVRFMIRDVNKKRFMKAYPERLNEQNIKCWKLNDCSMPNEDWVLLKN